MAEKLKGVKEESLVLHVDQIVILRRQVHWYKKEGCMIYQRNCNIGTIQNYDRVIPIEPDIMSLLHSQTRQGNQMATSFRDKESIMSA